MHSKRGWKDNNEFKSQGLDEVEGRVLTAFKGMIEGFYDKELSQGKIIWEKSRGWMAYIEYLKEIFNEDVKVIVCVRDVRAIVASFEKLYRKRSIGYPEFSDQDFTLSQTVEGRADILLRDNGVIGLPIIRLRDALRRHPNNLVVVRYHDLLGNPQKLFSDLHEALELPPFKYDFNNIKQVTHEYDVYHGYKGLHDIKEGPITPPEDIPWKDVLTPDHAKFIVEKYNDINSLALSIDK
jgi:sulfotransferase